MIFENEIYSYINYLKKKNKILKMYITTYRNYFYVIYNVYKKHYPCNGILKNHKSIRYTSFPQVRYALMNLNYDEKNDSVDISLENIKKIMYKKYVNEIEPLKKVMILAKITETMIPYISAYREATKKIIQEVTKKIGSEEEDINLSSLGV